MDGDMLMERLMSLKSGAFKMIKKYPNNLRWRPYQKNKMQQYYNLLWQFIMLKFF